MPSAAGGDAAIRTVCVFCGSRIGAAPVFRVAATALGTALAKAGLRLVYGGGRIGLMGVVAEAAASAGGEVIGIIPEFLRRREVAHDGLSDLIVTDSMHARKQRMFDLADAFVSLPGGLGTLDETFEIITWRQLGLHDKPVALCDVAGSAAMVTASVEAAIASGFAGADARDLYTVVPDVPALMAWLGHTAALT